MADQRNWRDASTPPSHDGAPDDASWALGLADATAHDAFPHSGTPASAAAPSQIVFIEGSVADYQILAAGVRPGVQVVILNPDASGVQQIADYLQQHAVQNLAAISIVADGADGEIRLGNTLLSASNIADYQQQLAAIGAALKPGGDLLLYGCDVAQNSAGDAFLGDLATATGVANIAAASHVVGNAAEGGSFDLDVDLGNAAAATGPFTAAAVAAYPDLLGVASDVVWYASFHDANGGTGVYNVDVNGAAAATNPTDVSSTPNYPYGDVQGFAVDPTHGHYFVTSFSSQDVDGQAIDVNQIIEGNTDGSGTPSVIYTAGNSGQDDIFGLTLDPQSGKLYFAVTDVGIPSTNTHTGIYWINGFATGTQTATELVNLSSGVHAPTDIAIDAADNLLFYTDGVPGLTSAEEVGVANLTTGAIINGDLINYSSDNSGNQEPFGIAVDPATDTLYWTTVNFSAGSGNAVYSASYTTAGAVTLSNIQTLATTNANLVPVGISLDVAQGGYYVSTESSTLSAPGEILFGSSLTSPAILTDVYSTPQVSGENVAAVALVVETQPTVTASGTATYVLGNTAVLIDSGVSVPLDADGDNLESATVSIASGAGAGDTLSFTSQDGITGSFNGGTLTLSGVATAADYRAALASVTFSTTDSTDATQRTIDWTVSDGYVSSPTTTSTVDVHVPPTVTAGATATFDGGGSPVLLDSGLTLSDPSSSTLVGASVTIVSETSTDRLNFTNQNGISGSYDPTSGVLALTGNASVGQYQTALESITYSVNPTNTDPTDGGSDTSRTIDWTVNDGVLSSSVATSAVDTVHEPPTVTAGGTADFTGGSGAEVALDSGLALADPDSGDNIVSATVTVGGFIAGDTLTVGTAGGLTTSFSNGTLTLSGTASIATYQTALDSVDYTFTPTDGDPTGGGSDTSRTIDWTVNDGVATGTGDSTLDEIHVAPTVIAGGSAIYPENGAPVALDPALTVSDPDSDGNLTGATVAVGSGFMAGDTLDFTNQNGITGSYNPTLGDLTLSGTASIGDYQTALQSVAYSFSGDPTNGGTDDSRTITWSVTDGVDSSSSTTSSLTVLCFCKGTQIATPDGQVPVELLAVGDKVLTASGAAREICWIGVGRVLATRGRRNVATPVIIDRHALAPNMPDRDLHLTKAHGLFLDGVLIPVEFLVNHRSIRWDDRAQEVLLYHIELETHDVLLANGAPAESYRDDGNRWLFRNANTGWHLPPKPPCASVLTDGDVVDAVWRRLLDRAGPRNMPPLTDEPDLHLVVDGMRLDAVERYPQAYMFRLPRCPTSLRIASRDAVPSELGLSRDPRSLGVALRRIVACQDRQFAFIEAADPRLVDGFHAFEPSGGPEPEGWAGHRWTDGDAALPVAAFADFTGPFELVLHLGGRTLYFAEGERRQAA